MPHLLQGTFVYNTGSHIRQPVYDTHTYIAERLAMDLSLGLPVLTTWAFRGYIGFEHPTFRLRGKRFHPLRERRGEIHSNFF